MVHPYMAIRHTKCSVSQCFQHCKHIFVFKIKKKVNNIKKLLETHMKKSLFIFLLILIFLFTGCSAEKPLRLHVIANSDSTADQRVKLEVRDSILKYTEKGVLESQNEQEAENYIATNLSGIEQQANLVLKREGFGYSARVTLGVSDFPEKTYGTTVYPAGKYEALKVMLGKGEGKNWWCVVFPPLCLVEADPNQSYDPSTVVDPNDITGSVEYESLIADWFNSMLS